MVEIKAFKGIRYDKDRVKDLNLVITPPYDVINEKEQEELYSLSEYNFINLILGREKEGDNGENKYTRAARYLKEWVEKGILKEDDKDSIYAYSQTFPFKGKRFTRTGFISLVRLENEGEGVLPHEKTLEKPLKGRLRLIEETRADLGCVFILYDDKQKKVDEAVQEKITGNEPDMEFKDKFDIKHKLWKISDDETIERLKGMMAEYQCVIADGHHRYKSAIRFKETHPELEDSRYTMCCFVNSFNESFLILPVDRFVFNCKDADVGKILNKLKEYFEINETKDVNELIRKVDNTEIMIDKSSNLKNHVFGMYCYMNKKSYFLKLKDNNVLDGLCPAENDVYKKLDINILHKAIFERVFGISEEDQFKGTHIDYAKGCTRALDKLNDDKYQFAFFINAPLMREIFLTARAGETMPQKSTYFYPKIYSGLVINKINK